MERESNCEQCVEKLLDQNLELWAEAVRQIGASHNSGWCKICDQLFVQRDKTLTLYTEIEITNVEEGETD